VTYAELIAVLVTCWLSHKSRKFGLLDEIQPFRDLSPVVGSFERDQLKENLFVIQLAGPDEGCRSTPPSIPLLLPVTLEASVARAQTRCAASQTIKV
jgi:hypothetical protein